MDFPLLKLVPDGQTDQPTDRPTLLPIELLSQLKKAFKRALIKTAWEPVPWFPDNNDVCLQLFPFRTVSTRWEDSCKVNSMKYLFTHFLLQESCFSNEPTYFLSLQNYTREPHISRISISCLYTVV